MGISALCTLRQVLSSESSMNMNKKLIAQIAIIIAVIAAGVSVVAYYRHGASSNAVTPDPNTIAPSGTVTAISADSISIQQQDAVKKTFAISSTTEVISQVSSGQVGKGLADIVAGDMVIIRPNPANPATAGSIQISVLPGAPGSAPDSAALAPSGPPASLIGSVVSVSPSMLVIKPEGADGADVQVTVTKSTVIRSNVLAGQKGKTFEDIAVGSPVFIAGTTGSNSVIANSVQVLVPIHESAQ